MIIGARPVVGNGKYAWVGDFAPLGRVGSCSSPATSSYRVWDALIYVYSSIDIASIAKWTIPSSDPAHRGQVRVVLHVLRERLWKNYSCGWSMGGQWREWNTVVLPLLL